MFAEEASQVPVRDERAGARGVNESAAAHIDSDVIDAPRSDPKKEEIPGKQVSHGHGLRRALLRRGRARDDDARLLVGVDGEAAAVEAATVRPAEPVARPDETPRDRSDHPSGIDAGPGRSRRSGQAGASRGHSGERSENKNRQDPARQDAAFSSLEGELGNTGGAAVPLSRLPLSPLPWLRLPATSCIRIPMRALLGRAVAVPSSIRSALKEIVDERAAATIDRVKVVEHSLFARLHGRATATTRRRRIYLRGAAAAFFGDPALMLHEYCHVLMQWESGTLTTVRYLRECLRHGYWENRYEVQARAFARRHQRQLRALLEASAGDHGH